MDLLRTLLTVSLFTLLLALLGGPLVLRAATEPARRQLKARSGAERLNPGLVRPVAQLLRLGGRPI
ncbi:hypothetical protein KLP40_07530 [Hymenobacter sp. NST-14]|uniref:hypothetical protein n=1 Tax=Hymenobacter piscis TaxID=2839984 RepID=UPI001C0386B0|nr:hypothetical protein [Hymenobacter piscis]MBT9393009.1 hypothetical protein [Hymenobacter piscis]